MLFFLFVVVVVFFTLHVSCYEILKAKVVRYKGGTQLASLYLNKDEVRILTKC